MPEKRTYIDSLRQLWPSWSDQFYSKIEGLEAFTMNADYLYWLNLEEPVAQPDFGLGGRRRNYPRENWTFSKNIGKSGRFTHPLAREKGTTVHFLRGAKVDINPVLREEVKEEKKVWGV